jgi:hypothetical protein
MDHRIDKLAQQFVSLAAAPGLRPWSPRLLYKWGRIRGYGSAELSAVRFVLWVWSPRIIWPCGRFDLFEALLSWGASERLVFMAWLARPWWCMGEPASRDGGASAGVGPLE